MGHSVLVRILNLDFFIRLQLRCHTLYIMQLLLLMYYTKYSVCKYNYQTLSTSPVLSCVISDIFIALTFQLILVTYGSAVWISGTGTDAALCTEIALCFWGQLSLFGCLQLINTSDDLTAENEENSVFLVPPLLVNCLTWSKALAVNWASHLPNVGQMLV